MSLARLMRLVYTPRGSAGIVAHVQAMYGVEVRGVAPLDMGVYRLDRSVGPPWVARVFIADRTRQRVEHDAALLTFLAANGFPAERTAAANPVSMLDDQPVLVTELIEGKTPGLSKRSLTTIGDLLGRLHSLPPGELAAWPGGSLHHVPGFEGLPSQDLELAAALLEDIRGWIPERSLRGFRALCDAIDGAERCDDLPHALVHPDPVFKNMIAGPDSNIALIDWGGSGYGPRAVSLAQFISVARTTRGWDRARVYAIAAAYKAHVKLTAPEIDRFGAAMRIRMLWFAAWSYYTKIVTDRPPSGEEWWLRRLAVHDPAMNELMHAAFG